MPRCTFLFASLIVLAIVMFTGQNVEARIFFNDSFESGDLSYSANGAKWKSSTSTSVSSRRAHSGSKSLKFTFPASGNKDSWSEQRFDLGSDFDEVYIRFYIYFPKDYKHRNDSPNNNKLIRIWSNENKYSNDPIKMGASLASSNISTIFPEAKKSWANNGWQVCCDGSNGDISSIPGMGKWKLTQSDLGRWISFEFHFKIDNGHGDGVFEFWVDGKKVFGSRNLSYNGAPCSSSTFFRTGYLLGWANSGFDQTTEIFIDDVVFSDRYIGPSGGDGNDGPADVADSVPEPPKNLRIVQ